MAESLTLFVVPLLVTDDNLAINSVEILNLFKNQTVKGGIWSEGCLIKLYELTSIYIAGPGTCWHEYR